MRKTTRAPERRSHRLQMNGICAGEANNPGASVAVTQASNDSISVGKAQDPGIGNAKNLGSSAAVDHTPSIGTADSKRSNLCQRGGCPGNGTGKEPRH